MDYIEGKILPEENVIFAKFYELGKEFSEFVYSIAHEGFYSCIAKDNSELLKLCFSYTKLGK